MSLVWVNPLMESSGIINKCSHVLAFHTIENVMEQAVFFLTEILGLSLSTNSLETALLVYQAQKLFKKVRITLIYFYVSV